MASKRRLRRQCANKVAYRSYADAVQALRETRAKHPQTTAGLHAYGCPLCGRYHVGHRPAHVAAAIRSRVG